MNFCGENLNKEDFVKLFKGGIFKNKFTRKGLEALYDDLKRRESLIFEDDYPVVPESICEYFTEYLILESDFYIDPVLSKFNVECSEELKEFRVHILIDEFLALNGRFKATHIIIIGKDF